jgi:hypothetical protein
MVIRSADQDSVDVLAIENSAVVFVGIHPGRGDLLGFLEIVVPDVANSSDLDRPPDERRSPLPLSPQSRRQSVVSSPLQYIRYGGGTRYNSI